MDGRVTSTLISLILVQAIGAGSAAEPARQRDAVVAEKVKGSSNARVANNGRSSAGTTLDRVADAVDGAESSHGADLAMWRPELPGPQGPMQVSEAATTDVGGGDRFDAAQNRAIGRAYLAQLYWRYKNWPDAIAAYNWGIGNVDAWVKAGRPADKFLIGVAAYLRRVLHDSSLCDGSAPASVPQPSERTSPRNRPPRQGTSPEGEAAADSFSHAACATLDAWGGAPDGMERHLGAASASFYGKLEKAMQLVMQHSTAEPRSTRDSRASAFWNVATQRP
jgi:hypothetical protein